MFRVAAFAKDLGDGERERLRATYRRTLGVSDQPFELTARAWCAVGRN